MGEGGYKLLSELELSIGELRVNRGKATSIRPLKQAIFWDGFRPPLVDGVYECFSESKHISIQVSDSADGIFPIAAESGRSGNHPLVVAKPYYFFWGFEGTANQMTRTGHELLPWACYYTVAMKLNPDRAFATTDEVERQRKKSGREEN